MAWSKTHPLEAGQGAMFVWRSIHSAHHDTPVAASTAAGGLAKYGWEDIFGMAQTWPAAPMSHPKKQSCFHHMLNVHKKNIPVRLNLASGG